MAVDKIILNPYRITGKQAYALIMKAIKKRSKQVAPTNKMDFCRVADMNRAQLYRYKDGVSPGADGVMKIARGLAQWGYTVDIDVR